MSRLADRIEITTYAGTESAGGSEWAPYRAVVQEDDRRPGSRLGGFGVLALFFIFTGITLAVVRGHAFLSEVYGISPESLLVTAWLIQGATALSGFVLTVRWLRSKSQ